MSAATTNSSAVLVLLSLVVGLPAVLIGVTWLTDSLAWGFGLCFVPTGLALWRAARS